MIGYPGKLNHLNPAQKDQQQLTELFEGLNKVVSYRHESNIKIIFIENPYLMLVN